MSVATELTKLNTNIKNAYDEIATKGGTIPQNKNTDNLPTAINSIPSGGGAEDYFVTSGNYNNGYRFIKKMPSLTLTRNGSLSGFLSGYENLEEIGNITATTCNNVSNFFSGCSKLTTIGTLTFGTITRADYMFYTCNNIVSVPLFDTSTATNLQQMFRNCDKLETVPVYNWSSATSLSDMFNSSYKLTDQSIDNVLQMCIGATSYTGTKTLYVLGFRSNPYTTARIQACPHYQDFLNAGWTIGY